MPAGRRTQSRFRGVRRSRNTRSVAAAAATAAVLAFGVAPLVAAPSASAAPSELFFSEYVEGSSNNKALEVYNGTGSSVDLAADGYGVQVFFNGSSTPSTIALTGTVVSGGAFVLASSTADQAVLGRADQTTGASLWNGDDAIALVKTGAAAPLDVIGQIGTDPGSEWGAGLTSTKDHTLRRAPSVQAGDPDGSDTFDPAAHWTGYPVDTFDGLGEHVIDSGPGPDAAPDVVSGVPNDGAVGVSPAADLTVTFSEPVAAADGAFSLTCSVSGAHPVALTGGPMAFTLDPATDLALGETCTLTVDAASVTDLDADDPPDAMPADVVVRFATLATDPCVAAITPIPAIQGSGDEVAVSGPVTTRGVVVGDYEGPSPALRGFYLQDAAGDGDPATSDGIFVFEGSGADAVQLGDIVTVTGTAGENQGQSQISLSGPPTVCGATGSDAVTPTDVSFPVERPTALERYEGMLVRLPQAMSVTEHYLLGRFGQVTLSQGGRLAQPTNVVAPGAPAAALQAENNLRKITLDDATQAQNPDPVPFARGGQPLSASNTLRGGDTATGLVGVLGYTWGGNAASPNAYRIRPTGSLGGQVDFLATNARPVDPPDVGGDVRVASMNLLNFFTTLDAAGSTCRGGVSGPTLDCRGADSADELERQVAKTVAAVSGTDADVVAFMEMENNGYGAGSAEQVLVDRLNALDGADTWSFIDADARTGQVDALGSDAIKVGMLYRPGAVTPVGTTAALSSQAFVGGGDDAARNRPALAQAFRDNAGGGTFVAVANHLKSKGSACTVPDAGDGQANCNAVRVRAAQLLTQWLATDPTATADPDVLILGDLNSYAKEDPITTLEAAGYSNLIAARNGRAAYSYVFDGQWGYLDHALGSASITAQVTGVADWHINADEPAVLDYNTEYKSPDQLSSLYAPDEFRISDHDPVVIGLSLTNAAPAVGAVTVTPSPASVDVPVTVRASFSDADRLDTHTAVIDWGDGTSSPGVVVEAAAGGASAEGSVTGSHTYTAAGFYPVQVTVRDQFGQAASSTSRGVVVYDRSAGQVVGAGGMLSPKGAWVAQPSVSGRARVAFAVGYRASQPKPTGAFGYVLTGSAGPRLVVTGTALDYLVITGKSGGNARFAGSARLNGVDGFRYSVTAVDARRGDTVRVVVRTAGGTLVYDSGRQKVSGSVAIRP